jgi:hypothetical protein
MSKYSLTIDFESLDELSDFITTYNKIYNKAEQKIIKTSNDKRGSKTVGLHLRAKQYRVEHPELSYRQCLIEVSKQQEPQQDLKPELIEVEPEEPNKKPFEIHEENLII